MKSSKPYKSSNESINKVALVLVLSAAGGCTLAINPWLAQDPINLIKMMVLSACAIALLPIIFWSHRQGIYTLRHHRVILWTFLIFLVLPVVTTSAPWQQQFWGNWGRSTGILTYLSLVIVLLATLQISSLLNAEIILNYFAKVSLVVTTYCLIQIMELDPINWAQKLPFATLGNINFSSAFLGLANILYIHRLMLVGRQLSSRLFDAIMILVNFIIIFFTGSIQGAAICLAGLTVLLFSKYQEKFTDIKKNLFRASYMFFVILAGSILFLGTAGIGPLQSLVFQQTVRFRVDYWMAGVNIFKSHLWTGAGIDSYGDFYREYRSIAAAQDSPSRVTNTAHNVVLDLFAGGGLLLGLSFTFILVLGLIALIRITLTDKSTSTYVASCSLFVGWLVFLLISINQIGVTVWGFVFLGLILGKENSIKSKNSIRSLTESVNNSTRFALPFSIRLSSTLVLALLAGIALSLPPNYGDAKLASALKRGNFDELQEFSEKPFLLPMHSELALAPLVNAGLDAESVELAKKIVEWNSRSFYSWAVIAFSPTATPKEKELARMRLLELDPNNVQLRKEISRWDS